MTSSDLLDSFRNEMFDTLAPYLWSDLEGWQFMDEAQTQFCRDTYGIADSRTPSVTQLSIVPSTDWYDINPSIMQIRWATRSDTGRKIDLMTANQADASGLVFTSTCQGPVKKMVLGLDDHSVRFSPMPNETITINLSVYRMPLVTITDQGDQAFEIDSEHVLNLLLWMKHRAYNKQDAETYDRRKSDEYKVRFNEYCARAKQEQGRKNRVAGNVVYGGI